MGLKTAAAGLRVCKGLDWFVSVGGVSMASKHILQYQGAFFQLAVVFCISVHFLWKSFPHLRHSSSWSFGRVAVGFILASQWPQFVVADFLILLLILSLIHI